MIGGIDFSKTYCESDLCEMGLTYHHSAAESGYCRVDQVGTVRPYSGKFGEGVAMLAGRWRGSTRFRTICYFIKES